MRCRMAGRLRLRASTALLVSSWLLAARGAAADSDRPARSGAPQAVEPRTQGALRWYGFEILAADAALIAVAQVDDLGGMLWGLPLTGPLVHASNGRWGAAGWSFALRTALPVIGGLAANAACESRGRSAFGDDVGCLSDAVLGGVIGYGVATVIDASLLSIERIPPASSELLPIVRLGDSRVSVGLGFAF